MSSLLEYGRARPDRRRLLRRVGMVVFGATLVVVAGRYAGEAAARVRLLYWQGKCLAYDPATDFVVYEEGPGAAARIASGGGYVPVAAPLSDAPAAAYVPECLSRFVAEAMPSGSVPAGVVPLFVHGRQTTDGRTRLVTVLYWPSDYGGLSMALNLGASAVEPTRLVGRRRGWGVLIGGCGDTDRRGTKPRTLVIYAGQADAADPTRFTIRYVLNGVPGVLRGHLEPGGRFALVRVIEGAAAGG
jgi:hypothetical protein